MPVPLPTSIDETLTLLSSAGYIADRALATVLFLSLKMGRPLFLEGEAGVGKTEIAKVLAETLGRKLIRLQCYEGLDVASAVYEWNYAAQMVEIRLAEAAGDVDRDTLSKDIFTDRFLIKRPILQALEPDIAGPPILLIDELDRADEAFEAFLLEVLADNQVTVPEVGTIRAEHPPIVVVTTNRTREIHDALKRRCFYHWVDYPDAARELEILTTRVPGIRERLAAEVVGLRAAAAPRGSVQAAGRRGDDRLGRRADRARPGGARRGDGLRHARRAPEIPGRHRPHREEPDQGDARRGEGRARGGGVMTAVTPAVGEQQGGGRIADNIVYFARALRKAGLPVGPAAVIDAIRAVETAGIGSRDDFYWTLHSIFVKKREHRVVFHEAFELFWRQRGTDREDARHAFAGRPGVGRRRRSRAPRRRASARRSRRKPRATRSSRRSRSTRGSPSPAREVLQRKDFAQMTNAEIAEAKRGARRALSSRRSAAHAAAEARGARPLRSAPHHARLAQGGRRHHHAGVSRPRRDAGRRSWRSATSPAR